MTTEKWTNMKAENLQIWKLKMDKYDNGKWKNMKTENGQIRKTEDKIC